MAALIAWGEKYAQVETLGVDDATNRFAGEKPPKGSWKNPQSVTATQYKTILATWRQKYGDNPHPHSIKGNLDKLVYIALQTVKPVER